MWLMTTDGFFSATLVRERKRSKIQVRARMREHLVALRLRYPLIKWDTGIIETPSADYRWRCLLSQNAWGRLLAAEGERIDYDNFKRAAQDQRGPSDVYVARLHRVWNTMLELQDGARSA